MDDDASSANSVKNFWHHLKKLGSDNSDHVTEEIISMVNAVDDLPTLAKIWSFVRLLFFK